VIVCIYYIAIIEIILYAIFDKTVNGKVPCRGFTDKASSLLSVASSACKESRKLVCHNFFGTTADRQLIAVWQRVIDNADINALGLQGKIPDKTQGILITGVGTENSAAILFGNLMPCKGRPGDAQFGYGHVIKPQRIYDTAVKI